MDDIFEHLSKLVDPEELKNQDPYIYEEIFTKNDYSIFSKDVWGKNVLDIGANIGCFSLLAYVLGAKKIVSIEPDQNNYNRLKQNLSKCPLSTIVNCAMTGSPGFVKLQGEGGEVSVTSLASEGVEGKTLEQLLVLFPEKDDIVLKMDCEGMEYDSLLSSSSDTLRRFESITLEVHEIDKLHELLPKYLEFHGFEIEWRKPVCYWVWDKDGNVVECNKIGSTEVVKFYRKEKKLYKIK